MNNRIIKINFSLFLIFFPFIANAIDMDFYIYGGFDATLNAFTRVALIFNDGEYIVMFFVATMFGIIFGGIITTGKSLIGGGGNNASIFNFIILVMIGVALFKALIIPKGTIHIYDPVVNRYQAVYDVPDLIVLTAGITNKAERVLTEILDNGSAHPRTLQGDGIGLEMLLNSIGGEVLSDKAYIQKSIHQYISDCLPPAETLDGYTFNLKDIKSQTSNLKNELAKLKSPAVYTTMYSEENKQGIVMTCTEAWDTQLNIDLSGATLYDEYIKEVCGKSGFKVQDPAIGAAQLARCKIVLEDAQDLVFNAAATGSTHKLMEGIMISKSLVQSLASNPYDSLHKLSNTKTMITGLASNTVADTWLPTIKAIVYGVVLGLMPILALFIVTPLVFKSIHIMIGLTLWLALWGVTDAVVHGLAMDQVINASAGVMNKNLSLTAILMAPENAMKGLAILGKAKSMGIILATFISGVFFKISSYAFAGFSEKWQGDIDRISNDIGERTLDPLGRMHETKQQIQFQSDSMAFENLGIEGYSSANQMLTNEPINRAHANVSGLSDSGMEHHQIIRGSGVFEGSEEAGGRISQQNYSDKKTGGDISAAGMSFGENTKTLRLNSTDGEMQGYQSRANKNGDIVGDVIASDHQITTARHNAENENFRHDVIANNPNMSEIDAIDKHTSFDTLQSTAHNRIGNERNVQKQAISGSDRVLAEQQSQMINTAEDYGKFRAVEGISSTYSDKSEFNTRKDIAGFNTEKAELAQRNKTAEDLGAAETRPKVLDALSTASAINTVGEDKYMQGHMVSEVDKAIKGSVEIDSAQRRGEGLEEQLTGKAITSEVHEQARTSTRENRENNLWLSSDELANAQAAAENTDLVLNAEQGERVRSSTGITNIPDNQSSLTDIKMANDGTIASSRVFTGDSRSDDNSYKSDSSIAYDSGVHIQAQSIASVDSDGMSVLASQARGSEQGKQEFVSNWAAMMDEYRSNNLSISDSRFGQIESNISGYGYIEGGVDLLGQEAKLGARAEFSGTAGGRTDQTDNEFVNGNKLAAREIFNNAETQAIDYVEQTYPNHSVSDKQEYINQFMGSALTKERDTARQVMLVDNQDRFDFGNEGKDLYEKAHAMTKGSNDLLSR